jgi:hypothetical protein
MRKFLDGSVRARRLQLPAEHPWLDVGRDVVAANAVEEATPTTVAEHRRACVYPTRVWAARQERYPSRDPDAEFCVTSGYELFHDKGWPPFAIVVRAFKVERMGTWKTCQDYWLGVFPDGKNLISSTLARTVRQLWRIREDELASAREMREDLAALDDL